MADLIRSSTTSSFRSLYFSLFASSACTPISQQPVLRRGRNWDNRFRRLSLSSPSSSSSSSFSSSFGLGKSVFSPRKQFLSGKVQATVAETEQPKWWEKNAGPNMMDIHSTEDFLNALKEAGDRLVIAEFYGTWCASCRALFPKLCKTAEEHPEILFLKVNFDENKSLCKSLNVKVLPYFHFYCGDDGQLESFSCSLAKFWKLRDAIERHSTTISFQEAADSSLESTSVRTNNPSVSD